MKRTALSGISPAVRWSLLACLLGALAFGITQIVWMFKPYGALWVLIGGLATVVAGLIGAALLTLVLAALKRLPWQTAFVFFITVWLCVASVFLGLYIVPLLIFSMAAVYFAAMGFAGRYKTISKPKRVLRYGLLGLFGALALSILALMVWPGPALKLSDRPAKATLALPYAERANNTATALDDPSAPGDHAYSVYYYATPGQKIEPYPGREAIPTQTVNASELLNGWNFMRTSQLGFGPDALPLNAQVWMPEGKGPFPLTLIVHGNHDSADRSDGGYAYLGGLLASRGIIAASVDENFLNSSMVYDLFIFAGLKRENDARAFLLLEHLRQWHAWNADASSPFFGRVDFENLALIGHSRGGEAAAVAASFAQLGHYPDNGMLRFDYPFQIKTIVAIAPVHGQYNPAGLEVGLRNVNYLVLHGEHDMDVMSFMGANMYRRADVSDEGIKAQIWMQYANHGQFNSAWGASDYTGLQNWAFNGKLLMPMEEQQQAAKVFIGAFLEATLLGKEEYTALFKHFAQGAQWLPPAVYVTDYADNHTVLLDDYGSGYDVGASSLGLVSYSAQSFDVWTEDCLPGKLGNSNRVLTLAWGGETDKYAGQAPIFKMEFQPDTLCVGDTLSISLCSGERNAHEKGISFQVKLTDSAGNSALMSIDDFGGVVNPVEAPIAKPLLSMILGTQEPVLQSVHIPTDRFEGLQGDIVSMEWIFDDLRGSENGHILYADDLRVEKRR
ncbi:MAG: hypothetical protein FWF69_05305 [Firmicutes bacterium]|nr:hypothetical protein [Bacillota bacterium]